MAAAAPKRPTTGKTKRRPAARIVKQPASRAKPSLAHKAPPLSTREVAVRMYNVGFGDAFLALIPDGKRHRKIVFDCGTIEAAPGHTLGSIVSRIIEDTTDEDGVARIDVVVCTHRHKDHVAGFADPAWSTIEVREVWMPWTEHPTDAQARKIRNIQSRLALTLDLALKARALALDENGRRDLARYQDLVSNALMLSNDRAMTTLHSGFAGAPLRRFLPGKLSGARSFTTDALPGVKIHVMGPSRDPGIIRDMEPEQGKNWLRLRASAGTGGDRPPAPFSADFISEVEPSADWTFTDDDRRALEGTGSTSELAVAVALDKAVNGTSLMLMLEVAGTFLLFPGDAQWGTWQAAMADPQWKEMLERTAFYKIGHHGSHNATPRDFVERTLAEGVWAMASTKERDQWPDIPKDELLRALLKKKGRLARSDKDGDASKGFRVEHNAVVEARIRL
jgi:beta-lactamase superfamily II metal-dependent hydrolase